MLGRRVTRFVSALLVAAGVVVSTGAAASAEPFDDSAYTEEQRAQAEAAGKDAAAASLCGQIPILAGHAERLCEELVKAAITAENVADASADVACDWVADVPGIGSLCQSLVDFDMVQTAFTLAYQSALLAMGPGASGAQFIADPSSAFEEWVNDRWADSVSFLQTTLAEAATATEFHGDAEWWRTAYAATAGIGLFVMAIMTLLTYRQASSGKISPEELGSAMSQQVPLGLVVILFGPPVAYVLGRVVAGMTAGILAWASPAMQEYIDTIGPFSQMTAAVVPGGVMTGLLLCLLLFAVCAGLFFTLVVQSLSLYVLGAIGAIAAGMFVHPRWRRKAHGVLFTWLGLLIAPAALFLVLGLVLMFSNAAWDESVAAGAEGAATAQLVHAFMVVIGLGVVAFSPWALLKFFPLLPDGADSVQAAGGGMVTGAVASSAAQIGMQRAQAAAARERGGSGGVPRGTPAMSSAAPAGSAGAGATGRGAGGGRRFGFARRGGGDVAGAAARGGRASAPASTAAGRGAARSAGGAAKAAGGIATGGAVFAAHVGLSAAQAGLEKARQGASAAVPEVREVPEG